MDDFTLKAYIISENLSSNKSKSSILINVSSFILFWLLLFGVNFDNKFPDDEELTIPLWVFGKFVIFNVSLFLFVEGLGFFDFIPGGFVLSGVLNAIINSPFLYKIGNQSKIFLSKKIMISGGRQNILNIIEGYRDSISLIENLSNKNDWTRKIQIIK